MKTLTTALATLLAAAAVPAFAQVYYDRDRNYLNDPYWSFRADRGTECWNPRAGHFEAVRPGEFQNDLDMARCRVIGARYYDRDRYARTAPVREECWNPRGRHWEDVRPGERQDDLDYGRCRAVSDRYAYGR